MGLIEIKVLEMVSGLFTLIGSVISGAGAVAKGIFGMKQSQAEVVKEAMGLAKSIQNDEAKAHVAAMAAAVAEARSESWLTRMWRPIAFISFLVMLYLYFFGYAPAALLGDSLPPLVERIFSLLEVVLLAGYPARTLEKIVREVQLGTVLRAFVQKKIL